MKKAGFKFEEHTADVQVRCWGRTLQETFAQAAYGLIATITPDLKKISQIVEKKIKVEAEDKQALLFDFLSEFLYIFDVEGLVFSSIEVLNINKINDKYELDAILKGEKFDRNKHDYGTEVKAITYSYMKIEESKEKVEIKVIFDV